MKVERFEDLHVWQLSRKLVVEIYEVTSNDNFKKDYGLSSQIQRASVSVLSNIAEGFEKGYNKEFIRFLYIAKGSIGEVRAQLYVINGDGRCICCIIVGYLLLNNSL